MSRGSYENGIGRRDMLCSGGSVVFSSLITALLGDAKPARAQTISGSVPELDRAAIRVVVDNYHFALSPSGKIGDVEVERIGFPLSDKPPGKVLMSEFGLSMHLGNLLQSQEVTPSSHHSIMRRLLKSAR